MPLVQNVKSHPLCEANNSVGNDPQLLQDYHKKLSKASRKDPGRHGKFVHLDILNFAWGQEDFETLESKRG